MPKHIGKNQETLGYNVDTKKFGKFLFKKSTDSHFVQKDSPGKACFLFPWFLTILLVHRKEHVFEQSDSPRLAVMAVPEGLRCSLIALAPPPGLWTLLGLRPVGVTSYGATYPCCDPSSKTWREANESVLQSHMRA